MTGPLRFCFNLCLAAGFSAIVYVALDHSMQFGIAYAVFLIIALIMIVNPKEDTE